MIRFAAISSALWFVAPAALAVDGVLEINHACATHTQGCFPGDGHDYPVFITQPGSYRLTSNLTSPINVGAIRIEAPSVTLDLGGFIIRSTNVCEGYPTTGCSGTGFSGIYSDQFLVVVRNGSIQGMGGVCIFLFGASSLVEHVRALSCGGGIFVGGAGRVAYSFSGSNDGHGIRLGRGGTAEGNETRGNRQAGIFAEGGTLGGSVIANLIYENGGLGISHEGAVLISRNIVAGNVGGTIFPPPGFSFSTGDNLCNGAFC